MKVEFKAFAKVNLNLQVLGKKSDSFHEVKTLMLRVDLFDRLSFEPSDAYALEIRGEDALSREDNLINQAVVLFERETGRKVRYRIILDKQIPLSAGLGGGSSDAATTLMALNDLYQTSLPVTVLGRMATKLGSDTAFFLSKGGAAICRGRGERVESFQLNPMNNVLLLKPEFGISAAEAYARLSQMKGSLDVANRKQELNGIKLFNDLESPVFEKYLFLAVLKQWLLDQSETTAVLMSGSGSTMIAFLSNNGEGATLLEKARLEMDSGLWGCEVSCLTNF